MLWVAGLLGAARKDSAIDGPLWDGAAVLAPLPRLHPKSGKPDFGTSVWPKSDKSDFGWRTGGGSPTHSAPLPTLPRKRGRE
jgi:hypothetical protein